MSLIYNYKFKIDSHMYIEKKKVTKIIVTNLILKVNFMKSFPKKQCSIQLKILNRLKNKIYALKSYSKQDIVAPT